MSTFVRLCESLSRQNFNFDNFSFTKYIKKDGKKKKVSKTLEDIHQEYPEIDIERIIEETGVSLNYNIGTSKDTALGASKGRGTTLISKVEKQKLIKMGVINLEKESSVSVFVRVCESLNKQGVDFSKFVYTKAIIDEDGKKRYGVGKTLADISQEFPEIDIEKVIEETGVDLEYSINTGKHRVTKAFNGTVCEVDITEEEMKSLIDMGILSSKEKLLRARQQRDDAKSKNDKAKELELQVSEELVKRGKKYEEQ